MLRPQRAIPRRLVFARGRYSAQDPTVAGQPGPNPPQQPAERSLSFCIQGNEVRSREVCLYHQKRCEEPFHLLTLLTRVAPTAHHQEDKPGRGDGTQRRHRPFCGARREHQLEQRDGVAKTFLQSA
jgi:hypothetical protein